MLILKKIFLPCLFIITLQSCATIEENVYYYNEILIRNNASTAVKNVTIFVAKTQKVFRCKNITPNGICSNSFKKLRYQKNPIDISWEYQGRQLSKSNIVIEVPTTLSYATPIRGVLDIKSNGNIKAHFEQNEPNADTDLIY